MCQLHLLKKKLLNLQMQYPRLLELSQQQAAAVAVVAGAVAVDVVSVVEALATSEAGDTKATVDVDVAEADGEVTLVAGFDWGAVVVVLTKLLELSPATDVPGLPAVTVGVATSSACAL